MACHLVNELQLMGKFRICLNIRNITTSRNIKIMNANTIIGHCPDMAAIGFACPFHMVDFGQGLARNNRNTIIAFLTANGLMRPACRSKRFGWKMHILGFGFLKT